MGPCTCWWQGEARRRRRRQQPGEFLPCILFSSTDMPGVFTHGYLGPSRHCTGEHDTSMCLVEGARVRGAWFLCLSAQRLLL